MLAFIFKRLLQSVVVMLTVALIAFALFRYVGDPINNMVGQDTTLEERAELKERLGLNDPFIVQFYRFVRDASVGEFGLSYQHRRPVKELIAERLPATLELALVSAILALVIGIPMGVYTALRRYGFLSRTFMTISLVGVSLPTFLIGILLILFFWCNIALAAHFWQRRCCRDWLVDKRVSHSLRLKISNNALYYTCPISDDIDYAPRES